MKIETSKRIFGLDVMRAVAILLVLCSHTTLLMFPDTETLPLTVIRFFGAIGVDIFFVLSGFLIGRILLKLIDESKTTIKDMLYFLVRRWFRTLPNYYLILVINIALLYLIYDETLTGIFPFFLFLQNFASGQIDFFTESWSLSIEEYAYLIGPVLLLFAFFLFGKTNKSKLFLSVTIFIILVVTWFRANFHLNHTILDDAFWSQNLRKVVIYRIDSIYYGFIAAYICIRFKTWWRRYRWSQAVLGVLLFFGMHFIIFIWDLRPENAAYFYNIFYLPLVSLSIACSLPLLSIWQKSKILRGPITWISVLSYSLYLVNYSIVLLTLKHFVDISSLTLSFKIIIALLFWMISFALSYVLYGWFEKPIMDLRDQDNIVDRFR